ncbi:hypothetical protein IGI04_038783 [Brassica rapa subsp. trilocularis]|uniref:Uncharacterized protein n=1 Tax=Brassica rapa subsp. trilocularis TaxID=1813537 RepID=A0ABQ7LP12_BRACM|nr:hypothetical protein IGI04_038783 [Brassica rapa subsp. trilocularis]
MIIVDILWKLFPQYLFGGGSGTDSLSESILQMIPSAMASPKILCDAGESDLCRDDSAAFVLKFVAIASIFLSGAAGVAIPLVGKNRRFLQTEGNLFVSAKAFAAGVILATGFVHMLAGGTEALTNACLPEFPWSKFPFPGFFAMEGGGMHIVGIRAHAAHHRHSHSNGLGTCDGHGHGHADGHQDVGNGARHVVVSQILELGIVSHSIIIGLSLGVSQSPCTIRPLIAALSFHQFFEGFALGGCISQAQFKNKSATVMACFFALTTPVGIGIGTAVASSFNSHSPGALITEGILDSLSAGILVYMALVDLIAADFLSKRMSCNMRLQVVSYVMLFLGAGLMSALAIWA